MEVCENYNLNLSEKVDNERALFGLFNEEIGSPGKVASHKIEFSPPKYDWRKHIENSSFQE
jgi:hypothetical protein